MTKFRKLVRAQINALGEDEVEVVMSTAALARDGHILIPQGCRIENYRSNPIVLWSHDPDKPIGNAENVSVEADKITARVRFAPVGISHKADEIRGLTKAGVIRAVSIGFDPIEGEPLDPKKPRGGQRVSDWELFELSFVSVPSDVGAVVTARSHGEDEMADQTDAPGEKQAQPEKPARERRSAKTRANRANAVRAGKVTFTRGLYEVACLCYLFEQLGWTVDSAKWEAAVEGDASAVPGMLAAVLADLGDALLAMTAEEVAEALAGRDCEPEAGEDSGLEAGERAHIAAATSPAVRAFRRGFAHAKLRAGKTLSDETVRCLREAVAAHEDAIDLHRSAISKHKEGIGAVNDLMDRAGVSDPDNDDTQTVQKSDGTEVDEGSRSMNADFRRRQAALRARGAN